MRVIVLGAGIAGVTAAYVLGSRGHQVEVIEKASAPAMKTSFANGGQLSYTHAQPWANPDLFPKVFTWMFKEDAPLVLRFSPDPQMIRWGLMFLRNCTEYRAHRSTRILLRLGLYSRKKLAEMRQETKLQFHHSEKGILHIYGLQQALDSGIKQMQFQSAYGCEEKVLTPEECLAVEPALKHSERPLVGGIYSSHDESGDMHGFCQKLAVYCTEKFGTKFHYDTEITALKADQGKITDVTSSKGSHVADAYVMALGPWSAPLLRTVNLNLPIYPMKGYSITMPAWENAPHVSITDDAKKVVISRLGEEIRAAGTAEFAGYDEAVREARIKPIFECLNTLFPGGDKTLARRWACLRPQTPDGPPLVGKTKYSNLYLHTGHGTLGWTQSAGTSHMLADIMEKRRTDIELDGLEATRF